MQGIGLLLQLDGFGFFTANGARRQITCRRSAQSKPMQAAKGVSGVLFIVFLSETTRKALVRRKPYSGVFW
jgi:hypothetical protein